MRWKVIHPTGMDNPSKEKEAVLSLEGPDSSNDVGIFCHVDGYKHMIGWFSRDGSYSMMNHGEAAKQRLASVGFQFSDDGMEVRIK